MVIVRLEVFVIWRSTWRANAFTGWNLPWCKKLSGAHKGKQNPVFFVIVMVKLLAIFF